MGKVVVLVLGFFELGLCGLSGFSMCLVLCEKFECDFGSFILVLAFYISRFT